MIHAWQIWVIAGLLLWIIEIFSSGFIVGVFGTACLLVAVLAGSAAAFRTQLLAFGVISLIMLFAVRPLVLRLFSNREGSTRTNVDALVGESGLVIETIDNTRGVGRARISGEEWRAVTPDDSQIEIGTKVIVLSIEGCKLVVEPKN